MPYVDENDVVYLLRKRSEIRKQISTRKSVQEGKSDRLCELLDEAANEIESLRHQLRDIRWISQLNYRQVRST